MDALRATFSLDFPTFLIKQNQSKQMSSITVRKTLSKKLSKTEDLDLPEIDDFKVISAQKLSSSKLDDHLNLSQPKNDRKNGQVFMGSEGSTKTNLDQIVVRQNPFLVAKLTFMRSQSSKQKSEKKRCPDFNEEETIQEILDYRTTFREQWEKQENMEVEGMKKMQTQLKSSSIHQLLRSV